MASIVDYFMTEQKSPSVMLVHEVNYSVLFFNANM